jgi:hypothetical protein
MRISLYPASTYCEVHLGNPGQNLATPLRGRVHSDRLLSLPLLDDEVSRAYCWQELNEGRASSVLVKGICKKANGHPLYLRYLIEYANNNNDDVLDEFPLLSGTIEVYYDAIWSRLLPDADVVNLLALMARLRRGLPIDIFARILNGAENAAFLSAFQRIRHLLLNSASTAVYHQSFTEFILAKTKTSDEVIHERIAGFCATHQSIEYCAVNVIFHLLRAGNAGKMQAMITCTQSWVDTCVKLGVGPDVLLADIEGTIAAASTVDSGIEPLRILLLLQRVEFRYNTLFAHPLVTIRRCPCRRGDDQGTSASTNIDEPACGNDGPFSHHYQLCGTGNAKSFTGNSSTHEPGARSRLGGVNQMRHREVRASGQGMTLLGAVPRVRSQRNRFAQDGGFDDV